MFPEKRPMMPDQESASRMSMAARPQPPAGGWQVKEIALRRAESGFTVRVEERRDPPPSKGTGVPTVSPADGETYRSKEYAFSTLPEAMQTIQSAFGAMGGSEAPPEAEAEAPEMADHEAAESPDEEMAEDDENDEEDL